MTISRTCSRLLSAYPGADVPPWTHSSHGGFTDGEGTAGGQKRSGKRTPWEVLNMWSVNPGRQRGRGMMDVIGVRVREVMVSWFERDEVGYLALRLGADELT